MNWYMAKLIFRIVCGDGEHTAQFDEQLRLVMGITKEDAYKALRILGAAFPQMTYERKTNYVLEYAAFMKGLADVL